MSLLDEVDFSKATSAKILDATSLSDSSSVHGDRASDEDTVQVVLSLPRQEAQRLVDAISRATSTSIPDTHGGPVTRQRTNSRTYAPDAPRTKTSPDVQMNIEPPVEEPRATVEMQGFLETERSYTNAFHKTLSLFIDDKTFSSPSLRAAVVGYLESSNATVMETLPPHDHKVPDYLRQEIENHVNLVKTVLQRGGVFAEEFLRTRLKKLAAFIPRLEAAIAGQSISGDSAGRSRSKTKAPALPPRSNELNTSLTLSPATKAANQAALALAAEAAARSNNRHQQVTDMLSQAGHMLPSSGGVNSPTVNGFGNGSGPQPSQIAIPPHVPIKSKTFVPPSLVPSQGPAPLARPEEGSPPPVLAPFDPRPNPMACLFCRQRKIRCIGHKPHPCEICVKRGFVCSYDWISRRGKRKPKGTDGTPL
ncbi:hypothetical protein FRC02_004714 [Tulasnella sp. 418]|nr:hypothetical protein FRC02_004714 [Tulasnella sp. 418]